jgi:L-ascorbate metabolism protein UlaG (beta-lactamase superfamily)
MHLTWLDANSWLIEIGNQKILLDPWLVDSFIFNNWDWLFKGSRPKDRPIPENIDLILLSQGLEDHAHPPTLKRLNRQLKVVASPNAAKVVTEFGYTSITSLAHGETFTLNNQVEITAFPGSPIGPTLVENSYLLKELATGITLYYEPHGYHSPQIQQLAPVDVVITPTVDVTLPLVGSFIRGGNNALEVAKWLQPQVMLPTAAEGEAIYEGLLTKFLKAVGTNEEFRLSLQQNHLSTKLIEPKPGDRIELQLEKRTVTC